MCGDFHSSMSTLKAPLRAEEDVSLLLQQTVDRQRSLGVPWKATPPPPSPSPPPCPSLATATAASSCAKSPFWARIILHPCAQDGTGLHLEMGFWGLGAGGLAPKFTLDSQLVREQSSRVPVQHGLISTPIPTTFQPGKKKKKRDEEQMG